MIVADDLTLVCDVCGRRKQVSPLDVVEGQHVLLWWLLDRRQRCLKCVDPLSDPSENQTKVRANARKTSADAAKQAFPRTGTQRLTLLCFIQHHGHRGATDDEMIGALNIPHQSVGPRRLELEEGGWIRDSGQTRPTRTGKEAIVWVLTDRARNAFATAAP